MKRIKIDKYESFADENIVNPKSNFIIIGYWWGRGNVNRNSRDKMTYDQLAQRLIDDCKKHNVNSYIVEMPAFAVPGGYQIAINFKPTFIKHLTKTFPDKLVVCIDTDMTVTKYPSLLDVPDYDFVGYNWNADPRTLAGPIECYAPYVLHTSGGILGFRDGPVVEKLLSEWEKYGHKYPGKAEDRTITAVFQEGSYLHRLRCMWLPTEYLWIPYFYELEDEWHIEKKFQPFFTKHGIKFSKNTTKEMTYGRFYNIKKSDLAVVHPEALTDEEAAAAQGADTNRIPDEWYIESGRKRRCLGEAHKLVNNPTLYLQTKAQVKAMLPRNKASVAFGVEKYSTKRVKITHKPRSYRSFVEDKITQSHTVYISCVENEDDAKRMSKMFKKQGVDYHIYIGKNLCRFKPYMIQKSMKSFDKDHVVYIGNSIKLKGKMKFERDVDFALLNASAYPVYQSRFCQERCHDLNMLQCLTTDVMMFTNNKYGNDLLALWDSEMKSYSDDRYALSTAFNKYQCVIFTRSQWILPDYFKAENNIFIKGFKPRKPIFQLEEKMGSWNKSENIYTYLQQCGERRPYYDVNEDIYYSSAKLKKYVYKPGVKRGSLRVR